MKKMLTISGNNGTANQNHTDSTSLLLEYLQSRTPTRTNVGKDLGKKEPSYTADGNIS
jgi:hypothetical protein